ncbi:hypothetical protein EV426DRAFT_705698 [Tirmania nivea]|nr:hypothetical protein EV426DRAFT_705698 [Tirmania nivea]
MPRTRRHPPKRVPSSPEAQDSDIEFIPEGALRRSSQPGSAHRPPKTPLEALSKRKPVSGVAETPSKRRCRSSSTAPEEDGDLPTHTKPRSQTKKNQRQEDVHDSDEWAIALSEGMVDNDYEDQNIAYTESNNGGKEDEAADSEAEKEKEYRQDQQYHSEELKKRARERRDLEFKPTGKVQTSLRTYTTRTGWRKDNSVALMTAISLRQDPLMKRDTMRNNGTRTIEINDDDAGGEDPEQDVDLQEVLRRSIHDTGGGQPRYQKLEPENSKAGSETKHQHPSLPEPTQVPTIGKSDSLALMKITLEIVDVPLHPASPKAKVMIVRFPLSLVGKKDILHCVSNYGTSILFVWNTGVDHGTNHEVIDLENLYLNSTQCLPETGKIYPGGEGMGKIEIPEGYNIMLTTEKIKCCDTGSGFSTRKYLIGISREREQRKGEGAWVVVRVGIVSTSRNGHPVKEKGKEVAMVDCGLDGDKMIGGVAPRSLVPPLTSTRLHGGKREMSPASLWEESPDSSVSTPVNLFGAKNVRPSDLELRIANVEVEMEIPGNYKSLGDEIAEEEEIAKREGILELGSLGERVRKRAGPSKGGPLGDGYDSGLEEGMEGPVKKHKIRLKEKRVADYREGSEGTATTTSFAVASSAPPKDLFTGANNDDGEGASRQRDTSVLGRIPKVVIPGKEKMQEELNVKLEMKDKQKEKEQEMKEKGKIGKLTKSVQKARDQGAGRVRGGACVKVMADVTLDGEDAFGMGGGDLYVPEIA